MLKKRIVTVFGALLAAVMLVLVAVPADATRYTRAEKREFKHWLRSENHDWRRWMHEQKYHWWKWVHEQKQLFYKGEWDRNAKFVPPGYDSGNSDTGNTGGTSDTGNTGGTSDTGNTGGGEQPAEPKPRFELMPDYANMAVRDNETGLVWEQSPNTGIVNLQAAWQHCARREVGGRMGWRLPAMSELTSLMDINKPDPNGLMLAEGHLFAIPADTTGYWSATGFQGGNFAVWYGATIFSGNPANLVGSMNVFSSNRVWCVKGSVQGPSIDKS